MNKDYFIFNNVNSEECLIVNKLPSVFKPTKDIEKIEIEGRDGFLTRDSGSYRGIIKSVECTILNLDSIDFIGTWLSGSSEVVFSNEPDKKYKATIINQIEIAKVIQQWHSFIIQFECQPHKYALNNDLITLTGTGTVFNPSTNYSKPIIKIFGIGTIYLIINTNNVITLNNVVDYVVIDSELVDCYKETILKNNDMNGEFPILQSGNNEISWIGSVSKIEITPNWRYL